MQVHHSMDHLPEIRLPVVTVGSFDGVHAGHRTIIRRLNDLAGDAGGESVLVTFHPHPRKVLYPETEGKGLKMIYDQAEKCMMLAETGLGHLVIMEFTSDFAKTTSDGFVEQYLLGRLRAQTIVVGFNHYFGHNRTGNFDSLYRMSEIRGFRVEEIPAMEIQHEIVSSTRIRKALSEGNIQRANACLEHHFIMQGSVTPLPAAAGLPDHLCLAFRPGDPDKLVPPSGKYAVTAGNGTSGLKGLSVIAPDTSIRV
jgi:riboflavin kinase / FMN adenylyltransferase